MSEKEYLKRLGKKIFERREALGLSVIDIAKEVDISRKHIYRIEAGENPTNILVLKRIAKVFAMSVGELVNIE